ncbi:MAG: NUDIX domain-containing protein [Phycisphaerales bacterium]|nr:NUDIX domain-containing protein [Phycisphaerales bacterium]MCI0676059.1 NUDIX domain-containing protein [Phycisphaerales bacterium]
MSKTSAGLLLYRLKDGQLQVLLVHPGGPFWQNKDLGAWTIPKGEIHAGENEIDAAKREFQEETGIVPSGPYLPLGNIRQKSGKIVHAWAFEGDCDPTSVTSNTFAMEWPAKSGINHEFPEVDRAEFFAIDQARSKINPAQIALLDSLVGAIDRNSMSPEPPVQCSR